MFDFGIQRTTIKIVALLAIAAIVICALAGCSSFALVDKSTETINNFEGTVDTITQQTTPIAMSIIEQIKANALPIALGVVILFMGYFLLKQRGVIKSIVQGIDGFKAVLSINPDSTAVDSLQASLKETMSPAQRLAVRKYRKDKD